MTTLTGGPGDDIYDEQLGDGVTAIDGGGGVNTVNADWSSATGNVLASYQTASGDISDLSTGVSLHLDNIQTLNLISGSGDDTFTIGAASGSFDGGGGNNALSVDQSTATDAVTVDFISDIFGDAYGDVRNGATGAQFGFFSAQLLYVTTGSGDDTFNLTGQGLGLQQGQGFVLDGGGGHNTLVADFSNGFVNWDVVFALNDTPGSTSDFTNQLGGLPFGSVTNIQTVNITAGAGNDSLTGGSGDDTLNGGAGDNVIAGSGGDDSLSGSGALFGDAGDDVLTAVPDATKYPPSVQMVGGLGNDTLNGLGVVFTPGAPYAGSTAVYADVGGHIGATSAVTVNLDLAGPQDTGGAGIDTLVAVAGVVGTQWSDTLSGGLSIDGGAGDDSISNTAYATGGAGDDAITNVAVANYSGAWADYSIVTDNAGVTTVTDLRKGSPDGTDTLKQVSQLGFSDTIIDLPAANGAPTPVDDSLTTVYAAPVTVSAASLLANDTDPDGNVLTLTAVGGAQHGTVTLNGGTVTFTPFVGYVGAAGFSYTVDDGNGGTATGQVSVSVTGTAPAYLYRGSITTPETIDFTGDGGLHRVLVGSGDTTVLMGSGGGSAHLGAGNDTVIGGTGKDAIIFGPGLGIATGGAGPDAFVFVKGQIADPSLHGGQYDTVTDFTGAGGWVPGRDFIWLQGFSHNSSVTYEGDLASDPTAHLYRVDDGAYHAEFVLQFAGPGVALAYGQYGFL